MARTQKNSKTRHMEAWNGSFHLGSCKKLFSPYLALNEYFQQFGDWPNLDDYGNAYRRFASCADETAASIGRFSFVTQASVSRRKASKLRRQESQRRLTGVEEYVRQIVEEGLIPTRLGMWHDHLNFLSWARWPRSKAALYERYYMVMQKQPLSCSPQAQRPLLNNRLTLLDEGGLILWVEKASYEEAKHNVQDKALGFAEKAAWFRRLVAEEKARLYLFGHGAMECLLAGKADLTLFSLTLPNDCEHRPGCHAEGALATARQAFRHAQGALATARASPNEALAELGEGMKGQLEEMPGQSLALLGHDGKPAGQSLALLGHDGKPAGQSPALLGHDELVRLDETLCLYLRSKDALELEAFGSLRLDLVLPS